MPGEHRKNTFAGPPPSAPVAPEPRAAGPVGPPPEPSGWRVLGRALSPRATRAQVLAGFLCALLGFAVVVQVRQTNTEGLSVLRQSDLVRILDETTQRATQLERESAALERTRQELLTGSDQQQAALDAATETATTLGILSGRLPAQGPGITLVITEPSGRVPALTLFNVLEELRNSGAEAIQLGDLRLVASSHFVDTDDGVEVDGVLLTAPYQWIAIGDPETMAPALEIPGGALAAVRTAGGRGTTTARDLVEINATRVLAAPEFATANPADEG